MRLYLEIIEGPAAGQRVNLKKTASIGRRGADIVIEDPKLSGIHGIFKKDENLGWILSDNGSRNGIWVKGIREHEISIYDGLEVQLGQTIILCRVIVKSSKKAEGGFVHWLQQAAQNVVNGKDKLKEIKPEMRLKVIQGLQFGETWEVFFGPRLAGKEQMDICLYDEQAPEEAFEIRVKRRYPYFRTKHPEHVKVNGVSIVDKQLVPGDVIEFGESKILVEFDNGHGFSS